MIHSGVTDNNGYTELGMVVHVCNPRVGEVDRRIRKVSWSVTQLNLQALGVPMRDLVSRKKANK